MVRGPDYRALPPFRALPSKPIALAEAEKLLTAYLDASEIRPHLHPDAALNPAGVQFSLQGGSQGGITLHNLRRVQAGLRGENLAPEPYEKDDAIADDDPEPQEAEIALLNAEEMADELEMQEQAASEAIGQDPLQYHHQPSSPPEMDEIAESESDFEEDNPKRYISSTNNKGMFSKKKQKTKSDDSRLDAKIREAALKAKRKRQGSEATPDAQEEGEEIPKGKKAKKTSPDIQDVPLNDEEKKAKKEAKIAAKKAEKEKMKIERKAHKVAKIAALEKKVAERSEKGSKKKKGADADSQNSALQTTQGPTDAQTEPAPTTSELPESPIKKEPEEKKTQAQPKRDKISKAEKREKMEKKKAKAMKATA